jgi:gliding motility-associated-like protein
VVTGDQVCFIYTPNTNYHGNDQVCIQVCDNGSPILCDTASINIEVISVNDAPVTVNEHETTCNTSSISGNLLNNGDNDPDGSALTATLVQLSGPAHGTFSIQANGDYIYTPELTYSGPDQVVISVCDNAIPQPVRCTNDTLFINVVPSVLLTAGRDTAICEKAASFRLDGAAALNFTTVHWTSSGKGTFDDASLVNPTYTPATADIASGSVVLTMSGTGITPCGDATDAITLAFAPAPTANAGNDETFCNSASFKVQHALAANYTSLLWEYAPAYAGTLSDVATLSPTFTPAADFTGNVTLTLKAMGNPVCGAEVAQDQMTLTIVTGISLSAGADQVIPTGTVTTLHGTASGGSGAYAWSWESSASLVNPVVATPQTLALTKQTSFVLTVLDLISGCSAQDQTVVSIALTAVNDTDTTGVNTPSVIPVLANDAAPGRESIAVTICGNPLFGSVTVNSDNTITYTPTDKYIGDDKFCYMICDNGDPAVCDTATVFIRVKARVDNLLIFNLITPNNDNSNDGWIIRGIEDYPDNTVVIFNRWGDKVKELTGYDNKDVVWDGTNTKGEVLPSGTYYYILTIDNVGSRTGWIYLQGKEK